MESDNPHQDPLIMRPIIILLLLDQLVKDVKIPNSFEQQHIGIVGYSIGAYTALIALGGQPSFDGLEYFKAQLSGLDTDFFWGDNPTGGDCDRTHSC